MKVAEPLFGRPAARVMGKVAPLSRESRRSTAVVLMPLAFVPATFQVTVWLAPAVQRAPAAGAVTAKGPAVVATVRATGVEVRTPPRPSRRVQRKFSRRVAAPV